MIRNIEEESVYSKKEVQNITKQAVYLNKLLDNQTAIDYINEQFRIKMKNKFGNLNSQMKRIEEKNKLK
jgi:hypothetical protein